MVGIDIVDHSDKLLRKRDSRAFRLISHKEDNHDLNESSLEDLFWLYWAAKESIYKCNRKLVRFDPKQIPIRIRKKQGEIIFTSGIMNGTLIQNKHYTLAVCAINSLSDTYHHIYRYSTKNESETVRSMMVDTLANRYAISAKVGKDSEGLPLVHFNNSTHLATFTHHHTYLGFICEK